MAQLVEIDDSPAPRTFSLTTPRFVLGRGPESELQHLFAGSLGVSRQHAAILQIGNDFFLEDLQSRNGTTLNGQKLAARAQLHDGDSIGISNKRFRFHRQPFTSVLPAVSADTAGTAKLVASAPVPFEETAISAAVSNAQQKLQAILGLMNQLGQSLEVNSVLHNLSAGLLRVFPKADQAFAGLINEELKLTAGAFETRGSVEGDMRISRTLLTHVLETKAAVLSSHLDSDPRFVMSQSIAEMKCQSLLCAPLLTADKAVFGIVQLGRLGTTARLRVFDEQDLEVLASVASQASVSLRYAQAHKEALRRQALDQDLKLAHRVQLGILPSQAPRVEGYQFFSHYLAAYEVGGDYYDYVPLSGGRVAIVVADASGKGVSAALLMAKFAGELRFLLSSQPSAAAAVAKLNESLCESDVSGRFVTLAVLILDPQRHELTLVNAGHLPPLLRSACGAVTAIEQEKRGAAVGLFSGYVYTETRFALPLGASVVLYTDGFSEAANGAEKLYGTDRLKQQLERPGNDLAHLGQEVVNDVVRFTEGHPQSDDMCLVCVRRIT